MGLHHFARRIDTFSFQFGTSQLISSPSICKSGNGAVFFDKCTLE